MAIESIEWLIENSNKSYKFIVPKFSKGSKFGFVCPNNFRGALKAYCKLAKIPYIGIHGAMRKTFATLIAKNSEKSHRDMIASIQHHLGHKSPQMTLHSSY